MSFVLVAGGAGYIGSHTVVGLIESGYRVLVVDNLSNSSYDSIARIEALTKTRIAFQQVDLTDFEELVKIFEKYPISTVIHLAGLKAAGESTQLPLLYYHNNISTTINLLRAMAQFKVKNLVFSSSATVYGEVAPEFIPIPENCPVAPTNPYGRTKLIAEDLLRDLYVSDRDCKFAILRYFNPIGAHPSGLIGEDPLGHPNNLLPFLAQVSTGRQKELKVFGSDYNSKDGTAIRDYIHVQDLAKAHVAALKHLLNHSGGICREWNLGSGKGSTVLDIYNAFTKAVGKDIPHQIVGRRPGDVANLTADPTRANKELGWKTELTIDDACRDLWNWTQRNPYGYSVKNYSWSYFDDIEKDIESRLHVVKSFNGNFEVAIANYGATIVYCKLNGVPLSTGFGYERDYKRDDNPFFGATVGRIANRVGKGELKIEDSTYHLPLNEFNKTALHGGYQGYDKRLWLGPIISQDAELKKTVLEFRLIDKDGTEGYPGDLEVVVRYSINDHGDGGEIGLEFEAQLAETSTRILTGVNLANHSYWNISGSDNIEGTKVQLITDQTLEVDLDLIPTGKITPNRDLDSEHRVVLGKKDPFIDYCFVVGPQTSLDTRSMALKEVMKATHDKTKIEFTVLTTEPAFQFYTGDYVSVEGLYGSRAGFCLETTKYVYHPSWFIPLKKGEVYGSNTIYRFQKF